MSDVSGRSGGPAQKFTPEVLAAVPEWCRMGASPEEIAVILGTTVNSLRVSCSRAGVLLRSAGRPTLSPGQWARLRDEAELRGVTPPELMTRIVAAVVDEQLYCAVLGDFDDLSRTGD